MKRKSLLYLVLIGLISLLAGCEKDGSKVTMLGSPVVPTITTMPTLTLVRAHGTDVLKFVGTPVDPGFQASATYFLEACAHGNNFASAIILYSGVQDTSIKFTVSDLNGLMLKKFDPDVTTSIDVRIRSVLTVDAGTGAWGTSTNPMVYLSPVSTVNLTTYGLPRLDLLNSGITQKLESPLGNGIYSGFVKLDATKAFTLKDPDANKTYGQGTGTNLVLGGTTGIAVSANGWYKMTANTNTLTYTIDSYMIGLVGSATPNGWNTPDQKMDYNSKTGTWYITATLVDGEIKFRLNDGWAWNLGGTPGNLVHNGSNLAVTAGTYTITLTITVSDPVGSEAGTCTIVKQ